MAPVKSYDFRKIEPKWQKFWQAKKTYEPDFARAKKPFYNLMMFPYPSAEGLHVGNMYAFTGSDIYGRMKRMQGYDVFEPIGLDGFGIHSENYAMKIGVHPMKQAKISEKRFYRQLQAIGSGFSWNERVETYDPEYYRFTQWLFREMWKRGLAYRKKQAVNWCPSCKTVLADEQVEDGKCERCGTVVIKKDLEQWFFRITSYAERLLKNIDTLDWSDKVRIAQRNWIGKSEGALLSFPVEWAGRGPLGKVEVFTTRPDTLFGATYLVIAPEHEFVERVRHHISNSNEVDRYVASARAKTADERIAEGGEKTGVELKGIYATNPVNGRGIPVWIADYVLASYGTGAVMAVPAHDVRDHAFAKKYGLPIEKVVTGPSGDHEADHAVHADAPYEGGGILVNSGKFTGMDSAKAKWAVVEAARGERTTHYRLRDWLISRQRYWGAPIPMIFCRECAAAGKGEREEMPGWYAAPEKDLPVKLPFVKEFRPTGKDESPLASVKSFYEAKCPGCKRKARRETDVSDTFLDSAWYYLRYLDPKNKKKIFDKARGKRWLPVDMYIGGAEHAVLHLLYVRFLALVLHDARLLSQEESFTKFRAHGLIIKEGAKMSKSKGNVVNPDEYIKNFGADTLRTYLMFLAPFEQGGDFRDEGIRGVSRFLTRVWHLGQKIVPRPFRGARPPVDQELLRAMHRTVKKVTDDIDALSYNTAISALMILLNDLERRDAATIPAAQWGDFLKLLAPFAPHLTEELWHAVLGNKTSLHRAPWPKADPALLVSDTFTLVIQVNGKTRDTVPAPAGLDEPGARALALGRERIQATLGGVSPRSVIYVPGKIINILT